MTWCVIPAGDDDDDEDYDDDEWETDSDDEGMPGECDGDTP